MIAPRLLPFMLGLAACTALPESATRVTAQGGTEIRLQDGRNCWNNQCITFNSVSRTAAATGRIPVRLPRSIDISDGYVSDAEFAAIFSASVRSFSRGAGRR